MTQATYRSGTVKSPAQAELDGRWAGGPQAARPFTASCVFLLLALFAVSLGLQLVHHFLCDHSLVMFGFDGKHYLATCQAMTSALMLLFKGNFSAFLTTVAGGQYCKNLVWDGPIIPGLPALCFAIAGRVPKEIDWPYFAVFFSVLASLSAVLLAAIARLITGSNRLALTAGLLFALYPTTFLATGVYRSEILAISLMLTLLLALYRAPGSLAWAVAAGITGGVFAMVKPVMIPAIGLLCLFAGFHACPLRQAKTGLGGFSLRVKLLFTLALSGVLLIAPWSIYTALDCHKLSITAERGPSYNAGVGTDLAADGWCTMPETQHVVEAKLNPSPIAVFIKEWRAHPYELAKLTLRRVTRLWGSPWNDFREAVFGVPIRFQVAWHALLVGLGFMGLCLYLIFPPKNYLFGERSGNVRLLGNLAAIALLSHLSFIMFQTMGRYAYTSMPLMALFAAYGLGVLHKRAVRAGARRGEAILARAAAFAGIAFALLVFNCDAFTHQGESIETAHVLHPGEAACRSIDLANQPLLSDRNAVSAILLLVDCDLKQPDSLTLAVNGRPVKTPLMPLNCFNGLNYFLFDTMAEHAAFMRTKVQDFRQWRAALVEPDDDLFAGDGINEIELVNSGSQDIIIYGDIPPSGRKHLSITKAQVAVDQMTGTTGSGESGSESPLLLPSPDYFASDRMLVSLTSNESRINTLGQVTGPASRSYLKSKNKNTSIARSLPDALRIDLALVKGNCCIPGETDFENLSSPVQYEAAVPASKFHWFARSQDGQGLRLSKAVLKGVGPVSADVDLSALKKGERCTQIAVTIRGRARTISGPGRLGVSAALSNKRGLSQGLGQFADFVMVPKKAAGDNSWTTFEMSDAVPIAKLTSLAELDKLAVTLLPCPRLESCYGPGRQCSEIDVQDLQVQVRALNLTEIAGETLVVY